jgi:hypothetical protein
MRELPKRLHFAKELPRHLAELEVLLKRRIEPPELLSVEETCLIRDQANQITRHPLSRCDVSFVAKQKARFGAFLSSLSEANPAKVYPWTPASNVCGLLKPVALLQIDFSFPFDLNPEGILAILTSDLSDQLLLDYSMGDHGHPLLEMEWSGTHWGRVPY